ncbi:hypothetical protein PF005_g31785, partial [Phytophthora fragariae]
REDLVENAATGSALLAEQTGNDVSMSSTSVALVPTVAAYDAVVSTAEPPAAYEHSAITRVCVDVDDEKAGEAEEAPSILNPAIVPMYSGGDASAVGIAAAIVEGQPAEAIKQNSGYTMLLHERSVNGHFVYIEALKCGSTTRFLSHACDPNVAFFEMQNRTTVKVLAVMIKTVKAGTQLTVNYGKKVWFKCACDDCWVEPTGEEE